MGFTGMKRYHLSLRASVVLSLTLLMAAAMVLIAVAMVKVNERDLLQAKVDQGLILKLTVEGLLSASPGASNGGVEELRSGALLKGFLAKMPDAASGWKVTITDRSGVVVFRSAPRGSLPAQRIPELEQAAQRALESISFPASGGVRWFSFPGGLIIDAPLIQNAKVMGAVRLETSLEDVRETLWQSQKLVFLFIVSDVLVLVAFGTYIFSKLVVKPVRDLVRTAEVFQEGDRLPEPTAGEQNELGTLSQALNRMLERLAQNKEELRQHIASLEQANLELQRAQQEVIFSEKLASVGRLAAGIAHEIGNPIGIVLGYVELLRRQDVSEDERQDLISRMESEVQRTHETLRRLLDLTRQGSTERKPTAVNEVIRETLTLLDHQLKKQAVEVILDLSAQPDTAHANVDQLRQVFLNLVVNAADAMAAAGERCQGGELRVSTRTMPTESLGGRVERKPLRRRTDPPSTDFSHMRRTRGEATRWLEVTFADTGVGIAEENLERVFDPFFTTKEPGKG
ncbi:MAG TPA: histidine kinase dimerization/phospho-acceptor domain-containing protein, partial [Syntrophobacteria bacterium]|nr:histidine kinase dimerization/phospho-acceptor domain-containing protein [Syntrophobacteria bacterium]